MFPSIYDIRRIPWAHRWRAPTTDVHDEMNMVRHDNPCVHANVRPDAFRLYDFIHHNTSPFIYNSLSPRSWRGDYKESLKTWVFKSKLMMQWAS
jgi:hypothetical protein